MTTDLNSSSASPAVRVFCAYAHSDSRYRERLIAALKGLERNGAIKIWFDRQISPGTDWNQVIAKELETAEIVLMLISNDFVNSDYCVGIEMQRALVRSDNGEVRAVPVLIRQVYWPDSLVTKLQCLPSNGQPVEKWDSSEEFVG